MPKKNNEDEQIRPEFLELADFVRLVLDRASLNTNTFEKLTGFSHVSLGRVLRAEYSPMIETLEVLAEALTKAAVTEIKPLQLARLALGEITAKELYSEVFRPVGRNGLIDLLRELQDRHGIEELAKRLPTQPIESPRDRLARWLAGEWLEEDDIFSVAEMMRSFLPYHKQDEVATDHLIRLQNTPPGDLPGANNCRTES